MTFLEYRQKLAELAESHRAERHALQTYSAELAQRHRTEREALRAAVAEQTARHAGERLALTAEYNIQDKTAQKAAKADAIREGKINQAARNLVIYWDSNPHRMWDFLVEYDFPPNAHEAKIAERACQFSEGRYRYESLDGHAYRITKL